MRLLPALLFTVLLTGCAALPTRVRWSVVIKNGTTAHVQNAHVLFRDFESVGGHIAQGGRKKDAIAPPPIPDKATVVWESENGGKHRREVEVLKKLTLKNEVEVVFTILPDNQVSVTEQPFFKLPANWKVVPK